MFFHTRHNSPLSRILGFGVVGFQGLRFYGLGFRVPYSFGSNSIPSADSIGDSQSLRSCSLSHFAEPCVCRGFGLHDNDRLKGQVNPKPETQPQTLNKDGTDCTVPLNLKSFRRGPSSARVFQKEVYSRYLTVWGLGVN